ncbi:hypothetical protein C7974DRAFT_403423 [Boeremia exigua]|uniref:uncharacterized protein n=1 Tax=Boeremia exigua TaxID=749465 RepID=UPI001E8E9E84|nr:uncharacterized protein C7974DRAFT_403423 [Boeremia exigua]KAH6615176.1 hypothetical protein C7974DRAFT_403423 [Boeremia exigua]
MAATGIPLLFPDPQPQAVPVYLTPSTATVSDSSFSWNMAPRMEEQHPNANLRPNASQQRRSISPRTTATNAPAKATSNDNAGPSLSWVVGNNPQEMRSKKNMTTVRKRAMRAFLETNSKDPRKTKNPVDHQLRLSVSSTRSNASTPNRDVATTVNEGYVGGEGGVSQSSTIISTVPTASQPIQHSSTPDTQMSSMLILGPAPMVIPVRTSDHGERLPYDRTEAPLFVSLGKNIDPFRTMFQSTYKVVSVERMKFLCARFFGTYAMGQRWIPTVLSAPHTYLSTLVCASAHLDVILERSTESPETLALRHEVMHLIDRNILYPNKQVDDLNITALTQLIVSEVIGRREIALKFHAKGIRAMFEQRGGLSQLGLNGYLASTITWTMLESAILSESKPEEVYLEYGTAHSTRYPAYPVTATIPESPIYRPRPQFETLKRSRSCTKQTLDLLDDVHVMIELFLNPSRSLRRDSKTLLSLYNDILTNYPPISRAQGTTRSDYRYEAVRITAILQATAIMNRIPLSSALSRGINTGPKNSWPLYNFPPTSGSDFPPASPASPTNLRHDSTASLYASSLAPEEAANPYFDPARSSFSSIRTSNPSISSSVSHPSFSSIATSHSSLSSSTVPYPTTSRPKLSTTTSYPSDYSLFPQSTAAAQNETTLLKDLKAVLDNSNMSECWQDMAGVLLWIGLTIGAASHKSEDMVLKRWYSGLSMRASILLCFEHPEATNATMLRMGQLIEALGLAGASSARDIAGGSVGRDGAAPAKKRRV